MLSLEVIQPILVAAFVGVWLLAGEALVRPARRPPR
jgi:hypothetical protein